MPAPANPLKAVLAQPGPPLLGLWLSLASDGAAEALAGAGFDFVVVDGEHAPNHVDSARRQLTALQAFGAKAIMARPLVTEAAPIKQLMDLGFQSLILPMVDDADQARAAARAMRYPPHGIRGVAGGSRATAYGRHADYLTTADAQAFCMVQIESRTALDNIEAIAAIEGVDALFVGPADLTASCGLLGRIDSAEGDALVREAIERIAATGKPAATLAFHPEVARRYLSWGARMVVVTSDAALLTRGAARLLADLR